MGRWKQRSNTHAKAQKIVCAHCSKFQNAPVHKPGKLNRTSLCEILHTEQIQFNRNQFGKLVRARDMDLAYYSRSVLLCLLLYSPPPYRLPMSGQRKRVNALMVVEEDKRDDDNSTGASSGGKTRKRSGRDSVARDQGGAGADQRTYPTGARRTCLDGKCPWGAVLCDAATAKLTAAGDRRGGTVSFRRCRGPGRKAEVQEVQCAHATEGGESGQQG